MMIQGGRVAGYVPGLTGTLVVPAHVPRELVFTPGYEDPNILIDPFSAAASAGEELPPVFYWPRSRPGISDGSWVVTRYEDIRNVYQNAELYSSSGAANFQSLVGETFRMIPISIDPPDHAKYRTLLNPWSSPKAIDAVEGQIRATVVELIDGFVAAGECDVAYNFSRIYPVRVFLSLMGFPAEMMEQFLTWGYAILHSGSDAEKIRVGVSGALAYLRRYIDSIRSKPDGRLGSAVVHGEVEGRPLTEDEIIGTLFFLWVGGLDTVAATSALIFRRLALEPQLQAQLRNDPSIIPDAIEEFLRIQPIINSTRWVKKDHLISGVKVREGERVTCYNMTGNFDPEEFKDPREVRFDRPSNRHFTLASGAHRCLGSHLARRELRVAVEEFLQRVPPFSIKLNSQSPVVPTLVATSHVPIVWDVSRIAKLPA